MRLDERYPLPPGWGPLDRFDERTIIGTSGIQLSGLSVVGPNGQQVTGAAACSVPANCASRSYYELLERVSIVVAMEEGTTDYPLYDAARREFGRAPRAAVFPESARPERSRYSQSNAVALHRSWNEACDRAAAELVERDRVLRCWFDECAPSHLTLPGGLIPAGLRSLAEWEAYEIPSSGPSIGPAWSVVAVVGYPRANDTPLAYGFAARSSTREAVGAAALEAVQRFAFLYGEEIPRETPELSPTPDFHQEFFLYPPSCALLRDWLNAASSPATGSPDAVAPADDVPIRFVDLTPAHLRGRDLFVAKAICSSAEPLVFGHPMAHRERVSAARRVHPVA
jgi:hypothetical protein